MAIPEDGEGRVMMNDDVLACVLCVVCGKCPNYSFLHYLKS